MASKIIYMLVVLAVTAATTNAVACQGTATYTLTFKAKWSKDRTISDYPGNPHWSPIVGASHKRKFRLFQKKKLATDGVVDVAEFGSTAILMDELKDNPLVHDRFTSSGPLFPGVGELTAKVEVNSGMQYSSAITMMAPSPDWFAGARALLCDKETGEWKKVVKRRGNLWDAGSDDGLSFESFDVGINPHKPIQKITHKVEGPFYNPDGDSIPRLSTFIWTLEE